MKWKNTSKSWGGITQLFHWGIFLILIVQYSLAYAMLGLPSSSPSIPSLFTWHKQIGLTLFLLMFMRFWWREKNPVPKDSPQSPAWDRFLSKANIFTLYFIMFFLPLTGLFMSILGGHAVTYFDLFTITALTEGPTPLAGLLADFHIGLSISLYFFVGLHIIGALYHHFILKDNVLIRMFPQR